MRWKWHQREIADIIICALIAPTSERSSILRNHSQVCKNCKVRSICSVTCKAFYHYAIFWPSSSRVCILLSSLYFSTQCVNGEASNFLQTDRVTLIMLFLPTLQHSKSRRRTAQKSGKPNFSWMIRVLTTQSRICEMLCKEVDQLLFVQWQQSLRLAYDIKSAERLRAEIKFGGLQFVGSSNVYRICHRLRETDSRIVHNLDLDLQNEKSNVNRQCKIRMRLSICLQ